MITYYNHTHMTAVPTRLLLDTNLSAEAKLTGALLYTFEDGETSPAFCFKLPFLLSNGQNDAESHGFVITRAKKEAPATTTSALVLH